MGNFNNSLGISLNEYKSKHYNKYDKFLYYIPTPILAIAGFGCDSGKFNVLIEIYNQLIQRNIKSNAITYNDLGTIFNFYLYQYPNEIILPDLAYSINNDVSVIIEENNLDLFLIDIPGSIDKISKHSNDFGDIFRTYLRAIDIDIVIMCVNVGMNTLVVKEEVEKIKNDIYKIFIFVNNKEIDPVSYESSFGIKAYPVKDETVFAYMDKIKSSLDLDKVYSFNDIMSGMLLEDILSLY